MKRIYLDHAATSPLLAAAQEAMIPWLDTGNPSSLYGEGRSAKAAIDQAREALSRALGCLFAEVIFTSGATEAASLAIIGTALANENPRRSRILMGAAEHHCVLHTRPLLERLGYRVEIVPVDREAKLNLNSLKTMLSDDVLLTCAMHANNELGSVTDIAGAASLCRASGSLIFVDAVQTFGVPTLPLIGQDIDLLSITGHKLGGPKGAGALYVRAGTNIKPLIAGGGQERELRGGTENVAAIVGFAVAVGLRQEPSGAARASFFEHLCEVDLLPSVQSLDALPFHCHVRFPGLDAETVVIRLDRAGIAASSGAACSSGSTESSHVMLACGYSQKEAREGVRFTFGHATTVEDAREAAHRVIEIVSALRRAQN